MCRRIAHLYRDAEEQAALLGLADELDDQSAKLSTLHQEMTVEARYDGYDLPTYREAGLADESHTGAVNRTDWDLFLGVEPRVFVAENADAVDDAEEMRERAFDHVESCTHGHGLTQSIRKRIASLFLANVEMIREADARHLNPVEPEGSAWHSSPNGQHQWFDDPHGFGMGGSVDIRNGEPQRGGYSNGYGSIPVPVEDLDVDGVKAEVEKLVPNNGFPGRHRASYPTYLEDGSGQ
jgi:hypothetical protein